MIYPEPQLKDIKLIEDSSPWRESKKGWRVEVVNEGHEENVVQCNCTIHMKFTDFFHYANFFSVAKEICIFLKKEKHDGQMAHEIH